MNENAQGEENGPRATPDVSVPDTITIFFSDIRGFTDTTEELGDEVANQVIREQDFIVRSHIEAYGGDVVKTQGDSFMVAFKATRGAILCAIGIQRSVAEKNSVRTGPRIAIGIGINTGEPKRLFEVIWHPAGLDEQLSSDGAGASAGEAEIAAAKTAVQRAIGALTRVLGITHMDDPAFS